MASLPRKLVVLLLLVGLTPCAIAQDGKPGRNTAQAASPATLTGKERLGPKWTDEQRIDNCNVPVNRRGNKPRPSLCANAPPS
jgi:hypothetical protein